MSDEELESGQYLSVGSMIFGVIIGVLGTVIATIFDSFLAAVIIGAFIGLACWFTGGAAAYELQDRKEQKK